MDSAPATTPAAGDATLRCPLCDYDVRGLPEPRCPECGHRFEWAELTDPGRMKLKGLFEHERKSRGYVRTQVASLWPWRFWVWLRPAHRLVVRRLVSYAAVGALLAAVAATACVGIETERQTRSYVSFRGWMLRPWVYSGPLVATPPTRPAGWTEADELGSSYGLTGTQFLDSRYPNPGTPQFAWVVATRTLDGLPCVGWLVGMEVAPLACALLVLGIMRQSFARARVRPAQALRVATYAADGLPFVFALAWIAVVQLFDSRAGFFPLMSVATNVFFCAGCAVACASSLRLEAGVRLYLGVRRAWVVAVAWWVITVLVLMVLGLRLERWA